MSGQVPLIGIVAGRCFAGNAALLGCCDVVIATRDSSIGMGGPAMVEGGGLGVFRPEQIGPSDVQTRAGVIDILVGDEAEGVAAARRYLAFFQGRVAAQESADPAALRNAAAGEPPARYDIRAVVDALVDPGSALELRAGFGAGIVTALARIDGRPVGLIANNPLHLGGAIDADAADKAARFMQLCDAHALPLVSLIDTPGFMVGPEIESRGQVRHVSRMFVVGAQLRVPVVGDRAAQGLRAGRDGDGRGRHARADGDGGLAERRVRRDGPGRRGRARLPQGTGGGARRRTSARRCASGWSPRSTRRARRSNMAATLEIDAVIDPADSRRWLARDARIGAPARAGRPLHRPVVGASGQWCACSAGSAAS